MSKPTKLHEPAELAKAWCTWSRARKAARLAAQARELARRLREDVTNSGRPRSPAVLRKAEALGEATAGTALRALRALHSPAKPPRRRRRKRGGQLDLPQEGNP